MPNVQEATPRAVKEAGRLLAQGEIVVIAADGLYALCASVESPAAVDRVFELKERERTQALQVIFDPAHVDRYATVTPWQRRVLERLLPGPMSFIVKNRSIKSYVNGGLDTISLVWQDNRVVQQLYRDADAPYIGTSANPHGKPAPLNIDEAVAYFGDRVPMYLDSGPTKYAVANTIIDLTNRPIEAVRQGPITLAEVLAMIAERVGPEANA
jgi:L-threonylcarbamoyladenylate synthase